MRAVPLIATVATLVTATATANAQHGVRGTIAPSGMDFLAEQLPSYLPDTLMPPSMTMDLFTCPLGRVVTLTQSDTTIDLDVTGSWLSVPSPGVLRVELQFDVFAEGQAFVMYPYACFGSATCRDQLSLYGGRATVDFTVVADPDGVPRVQVASVDLLVDEDDIAFTLSDCAIDDVVNWVIDFAKGWLLDMLVDKLETIADDQMSPWLEGLVGGFMQLDGTLAIADFSFAVTSIDPMPSGLTLDGNADLFSAYAADACVGADPGEPTPHPGAAPALTGGDTHFAMAVNLGLVDDMLYQVWREGMTCLTPQHLAAMGIHLDIEETAALLPGFPSGTDLEIHMRLAVPPRVEGAAGDSATISMIVEGVEIDLVGTAPDGTVTELNVEASATATATIDVDPSINALTLKVDSMVLTSMSVNEEYAAETGLDVAQLQTVVETLLMPGLLDELSDMPLTGPIFGFGGYYIILRSVQTTPSHAVVRADLFRAPVDDTVAPDTSITQFPQTVVRPSEATLRVAGSDDAIPAELLRYRVTVDGVARAPSYLTEAKVGESSVTATYHVAVSAIDLNDNEDPTPAEVEITVDGVRPRLKMIGEHIVDLDSDATSVTVAWTATDDLTAEADIVPHVELYRIVDPDDLLTAELVGQVDLAAGDTDAKLPVDKGNKYRVVVTVRDEAGNATYRTVLVIVAGDSSGCGCSSTGGTRGGALPIVFALGMLLFRRRR
jgi:MYXO-CTERM domain-containing protein